MMHFPGTTLVKVNFRCKNYSKEELINSTCIIHISVGQEYSEGEKFLATMDLINKTFRSCKIVVCDTLQRHSIQLEDSNISAEEAYKKAKNFGSEWLARNESAYKYLSIDYDITRWDDWLKHENYNQYFVEIVELYEKNLAYRKSINETAYRFLKRKNFVGDQRAFDLCRKYLLEECPVLIPLWATTQYSFVVYPRFRTAAMKSTYDHFLGTESTLLREVALKFNPRSKPKRTSFLESKSSTKEVLYS